MCYVKASFFQRGVSEFFFITTIHVEADCDVPKNIMDTLHKEGFLSTLIFVHSIV